MSQHSTSVFGDYAYFIFQICNTLWTIAVDVAVAVTAAIRTVLVVMYLSS